MIKDVDGETDDASESLDQHCNARETIRRRGAWRTGNVCKRQAGLPRRKFRWPPQLGWPRPTV